MKKETSQAGFSIVEIIIGIVLFAISIPTIAILIDVLTRLNDSSVDTASVTSIAENKIESLRSKGYNGVPNGTVTFSSELPATLPRPKSATYTVSTVNPSLKSVSVNITYGKRQVQYTTYLGELGVGQY